MLRYRTDCGYSSSQNLLRSIKNIFLISTYAKTAYCQLCLVTHLRYLQQRFLRYLHAHFLFLWAEHAKLKMVCGIIPTDSILADNIPDGNFVCGPLRYDVV